MTDSKRTSYLREIRLENLRRLLADTGGPKAMSVRLQHRWSPSYFSQLAGPNPTRPITEETARELEDAIGLEKGSLDTPILREPRAAYTAEHIVPATHNVHREVDSRLLADSFKAVIVLTKEEHESLADPRLQGKLVALVYEDALRKGAVDPSYVKDLVELALH